MEIQDEIQVMSLVSGLDCVPGCRKQKQDRAGPQKNWKTVWVAGIQRQKQKGPIRGKRHQKGPELAGSCWPREGFQLGPKSHREPLVGFQQGKTGPDVFPFSSTHFVHSFFQQILIEQT